MTIAFVVAGHDPSVLSSGRTNYSHLASTRGGTAASESPAVTVWRTGGTFSNLYARVSANANVSTCTVNYRVGSATGNETLSIGSLATGEFLDTTHTDAVIAGNLVNFQLVVGVSVGNTISMSIVGIQFAPTVSTNTVNRLAASLASGFVDTSANTSYYEPLCGRLAANATEVNAQFTNRTSATLQ